MRLIRFIVISLVVLNLAGCASKFRSYSGPEVTSVQIHKADRKMYLLHDGKVLKSYKIALGGVPIGPKHFEGDGKTPEGTYFVSHRNPNSAYHLSLGVSYPNDSDRTYAAENGKKPGGDIMIHGGPNKKVGRKDWTAGCIAVSDRQIEEVYSMVEPGTPIYILP